MNDILSFYKKITEDRDYSFVYEICFDTILEQFGYKSQTEFEKKNLTNDEYQQILDVFEHYLKRYFTIQELQQVVTKETYYYVSKDNLYRKIQYLEKKPIFLEKINKLQTAYNNNEPSIQIIHNNKVGRPKKSYNIFFVACLIDYIKQEQEKKKIVKHIKIKNLGELRQHLNSTITDSEAYWKIIQEKFEEVEDRYFKEIIKDYGMAYRNIMKILEFNWMILENQKGLIETTNIDTEKIKSIIQEYINYFINRTSLITELSSKESINYFLQDNSSFLNNTENFFEEFAVETIECDIEFYRKHASDYKFKKTSIYFCIHARKRIEEQTKIDIKNNNFYLIDNHIQLLKDFSKRYIEKPILQVEEIYKDLDWQFHLSVKNPIRQLLIEGIKASDNTTQTQQLREFLIDYKWL